MGQAGGVLAPLLEVLDREIAALDQVVHRLVVIRLLTGAGEPRFLPPASDALEDALDELAAIEVAREAEIVALAERYRLDPSLTLAKLAAVVGSGPGAPLRTRRADLIARVREIESLQRELRAMTEVALERISRTRSRLEEQEHGGTATRGGAAANDA